MRNIIRSSLILNFSFFSVASFAALPCGSKETPSSGSVNIFLSRELAKKDDAGHVIAGGPISIPQGHVGIRIVAFTDGGPFDFDVELPIDGISTSLKQGVTLKKTIGPGDPDPGTDATLNITDGIAQVRFSNITTKFSCF